MGYTFAVATDDVEAKATTIKTEAANLETQLAQLTRNMGELAHTWHGTASGHFQELYSKWGKQAGMMQKALEDISHSLKNIGVNYTNAEQANIVKG